MQGGAEPTSSARQVNDLLLRWEELRGRGQCLSAEELCQGCPELVAEVRQRMQALQALGQGLREASTAIGPQTGDAVRPASGSAGPPGSSPGPAEPEPGQIGRYRILTRLGRGGMGAVYLAYDPLLDRQVALKVPRFAPEDSPQVRERFYREARAAAGLDHPNICPVHDVGESNGVLYLAMAYIDGRSLAQVLAGGPPLPPDQVVALVGTLARALHEAHRRGVIHRDLKPSNVVINPRGEPVVVDFGLARRVDKDSRITEQGSHLGTPAYMPPEQVAGDVEAMGPACDIYSLGVLLYELLSSRLPFTGPTSAVIMSQILTQQPVPPSVHRPGLDPRLEAVCLKAMAKKVEDRYASMAELAAALASIGPAAGAQPPGSAVAEPAARPEPATVLSPDPEGPAGGRSWYGIDLVFRFGRRQFRLVIGFALVLLALTSSVTFFLHEPLPLQTPGPGPSEPAALPPPPAPGPELAATFAGGHRQHITSVAFAPDGRTMATASDDKTVVLWDVAARSKRATLTGHGFQVLALAFAPDGQTLASASVDGTVKLWDVAAGKERTTLSGHQGSVNTVAFAPDGKTVASGSGDKTVKLWDAATGMELATLQQGHWVLAIAFSTGGEVLASGGVNGSVKLWDVATRTERAAPVGPAGRVYSVAFAPDGRTLATASYDNPQDPTVYLRDPATGAVRAHLQGPGTPIRSVVYAPDGQTLATLSQGKVKLWDPATLAELPLARPLEHISALAFTPDGNGLAVVKDTADRVVELWEVSGVGRQ